MILLDGYTIIREWTADDGAVHIYEAKNANKQTVQIRMPRHPDKSITDRWFEFYDQYQLTVTNFKYLPRVITTSILNQMPYTILESREGTSLHQVELLSVQHISQVMDALRHLHKKKMIHGAITAENIWLTNDGQAILYGSGESAVLHSSVHETEESDVMQLLSVIQSYSLLDQSFFKRIAAQKPLTLSALEEAMVDAEQHEKKQSKKAAGLIEKEEKKPVSAPDEAHKESKKTKKEPEEKSKPEQPTPPFQQPKKKSKPIIAAILSFFWSGVGQIYNGQIRKGLILIAGQMINAALMFVLIGFITYPLVWIWGIYDAYKTADRFNNNPDYEPKPKEKKSLIRTIVNGVVLLFALLFIVGLFSDDEKNVETVQQPEATESAASEIDSTVTETPVQEPASEITPVEEREEEPTIEEPAMEETKTAVSYSNEEIGEFMSNYIKTSVSAINEVDFSLVSHMLDPNGEAYQEQKEYIRYLDQKGITEENVWIEATDVSQINDEMYQVTTNEDYNIWYGDGSQKFKTFKNTYNLKVSQNGALRVHQLLSTEEISSEDVEVNAADSETTVYATDDQVRTFMEEYLYASVDAMNNNDFSLVSLLMDPAGEAYNESRDYIQYVTEKGITEELLHVSVEDITSSTSSSFVVSTYEEYNIYYGDGSNQYKTFNSEYLVIIKDGQLLLNKLIKVQEL